MSSVQATIHPMISVYPATSDQMPIVADLAHRIWPKAFAFFLTPEQIGNMLERIYSPVSLAEQLRDGHRFWIAYEDSVPIGYASAYREGETIWIKKLYILPEHQSKGVGSALLKAATGGFNEARQLQLLVNRDNLPAQNFYLKKGFQLTGEKPVLMGDHPFVDLIFTKPL